MMDSPPTPRETPAPSLAALAGREASGGPPPHGRRPARRRWGLAGAIVRAGLLTGLAWLTYANATSSRALSEAIEAEARGDFPTALRGAIEHLDRRPWSREAARVAARCLSRLDFAEDAEPYYRRGRDLSLADLRYRAYGLTRANLRERALQAFDDALRRQPDDVAALRLKAGVLLSMTRWDAVVEIGRRLSTFPPVPVRVAAPVAAAGHWTLSPMEVASVAALGATLEGLANHNRGEIEAAVSSYAKVLVIDPELRSMPLDRRLFWSQFGEDLLSLGRAADVIRYLAPGGEGRDDPGALVLLARAHAQQGSVDQAQSCWRRVRELAPDHPAAWLNLGRIELGRGHLEEAARLLARAASLAPESHDAAYNLGITYERLGQPAEAKRWEQEAARLRRRRDEQSRDARGATPGRPTSPAGSPAAPSP
jgi:tetratricopeptide (TPR) repeat protein